MTTCESVKVLVRCRPMNQREIDLHCKPVVFMDSGSGVCSILNPEDKSAPPKSFTFDGAYYLDSTTEQIYNESAYPLVEGVLEGYNGTVFAYGQTGCGKSFSMQGISDPPTQRGIIPRSFEHIFEAISTSENTKFLVHASYLEIYNEEIRDLLGKDAKRKLDLKEHPDKGVYIPGLSWHAVHNVKECELVMDKGWKNRSVGATLMNADSSRSHSIFTISLEMMKLESDGDEHIRKGKLNLVDLAGSERQAKTGATGDRLKEATKINLSLSALGNVISALVDGKSKHIPYRDSKLTRLLQDSLGGNTKTLMVACLSPADNNYDESLSTLRYANRAKNIQNKPKINEDPKDALLREYQEEIKRLKAMLDNPEENVSRKPQDLPTTDASEIEMEKDKLRMEYEQMMNDLKTKYEEEQRSNARLLQDVAQLRRNYDEDLAALNSQQTPPQVNAEGQPDGDVSAPTPTIVVAKADTATEQDTDAPASSFSTPVNMDDALKRLQQLEEQMVGGEKVHDKELKERRLKKKKAAEKRLRMIKEALNKVDDDDKAMLKVYDNIQEELKAKNDLLKKEKKKVEALQREIKDLQSEFEFDRTDYLETIRRQEQQLKLLQQILDKIQPCIRRDCNYSNVDRIRSDAVWDEDLQKWKMPDLVIVKTKLPPAEMLGSVQPGGRTPPLVNGTSQSPEYTSLFDEPQEDKFFQKLERGAQEDIAGNYFKPRRTAELLLKAQEDASGRNLNINKASSAGSYFTPTINAPRDPLAGLNLNSSINGTYFTNGLNNNFASTGNNVSTNGSQSPELTVRKPTRLEALPVGELNKRNKKKKITYNTMDLL